MPGPTNADYEISLRFRDLATGQFIAATKKQMDTVKELGLVINNNGKLIGTTMQKAGDDYTRSSDRMRVVTEGLRREIGAFRNQLLLVTFVYQGIKRAIEPAIRGAMAQELAERKLAIAFAVTGLATQKQVNNLKALATQYQQTTMFGDEEILNAQAILATFKLTSDQVARLTPIMLNLATAYSQTTGETANLDMISKSLGKAYTGNAGALSRYGVQLSDSAKKSRDFSKITGELELKAKGMAERLAGTTFQGQLVITSNMLGEYMEQLGQIAVNSPVVIAAMTMFKDEIVKQTKALKDNIEQSKNFYDTWLFIGAFFISLKGIVMALFNAFKAGLQWINLMIASFAWLITNIPGLSSRLEDTRKVLEEFIVLMHEDFLVSADAMQQSIRNITIEYQALIDITGRVATANSEMLEQLEADLKGAADNGTQNLKEKYDYMQALTEGTASAMENSFSNLFFDAFTNDLKGVWDYVDAFAKDILRMFAQIIAKMLVMKMMPAAFGMVMHSGGIVNPNRPKKIMRFQHGGVVPALLETGEGVVNRRGMAAIGARGLDRINRGMGLGEGGNTNNYYIQAMDVKSFRDYLAENQDIFVASVQGNIEGNYGLRKLFRSGI